MKNGVTPEELRAEVIRKRMHRLRGARRGADEVDRDIAGGARYRNPTRNLVVLLSCSIEADGRAWLHFSLSHRERVPTHGEMKIAKQVFLGDRYAYAVWPPARRYVNLHPNVLHLFALLDEDAEQPLPDFTGGTGSI